MDIDIQFGEVEEAAPQPHLRPDRNKHYAVAAYGEPIEEDLPIFVDLDVMRDMEQHALEDTSVELGGVMLGGQFEDEDGRPFVVVTDSLRAEHYEATKGSFKFTHDTWAEISKQRDEFPPELQMVGWYHTHPDWGVFLSGMDMFICDNFFNKPLDVALVIDPCRDDRGLFQWTGDPGQRVRRTGGFYLIASRFRAQELEWFADVLEGTEMARDTRFGGFPQQAGGYSAPVVNIAEQRSQWPLIAVMGMLTMQFLLLAVLCWRMVLPEGGGLLPGGAPDGRLTAKEEVISEMLKSADISADKVIDQLANQRELSRKMEYEKQGLYARIKELDAKGRGDQRSIRKLESLIKSLQADIGELKEHSKDKETKIARLQKRLAVHEPDAKGDPANTKWNWTWIATISVISVLLVVGLLLAFTLRPEEAHVEPQEEPQEEPPQIGPPDEIEIEDGAEEEEPPEPRE